MSSFLIKTFWIIVAFVLAKVVNEILYRLFDTHDGKIDLLNALIPAIGGTITFVYISYKALINKQNEMKMPSFITHPYTVAFIAIVGSAILLTKCVAK